MSKTKNILVFFMSNLHSNEAHDYYSTSSRFHLELPDGQSVQTNETAIRTLKSRLEVKGEKLDKVFAFATRLARSKNNAVAHLIEVLPELASSMELVEIDEDLTFKNNLVSLGEMKGKLEAYVTACNKEAPNTKIQVHLDITGGFRHASMLMSALIQLLNYNQLETKNVIYTKYVGKYFLVEDAHEVLDMYKLISGVEEFVHYGSVRILKKYFDVHCPKYGIVISDELKNLLLAMEDLSNRLNICNCQEEMTKSVIKLMKGLDKYLVSEPEECIEKFFINLLPDIKREYQPLFDGIIRRPDGTTAINVFALIHWAAKRDILQQALVYYTEWVPEFLAENKWFEAHADLIADCDKLNKAASKWYDYLFTAYNRWNKELKLSKVTSSSLAFVCSSRKYEKWLNIKLFNNHVQRISLQKCMRYGTTSVNTLNCMRQFIDFVMQLNVSCGSTPNKNTFVAEARSLYDQDKIANKPCGFAEAIDVACLYFDRNNSAPLSVDAFFEAYYYKFPYYPNRGRNIFCYDLFAEYLLGILNYEKSDSINGKYQVSKLSKVLLLPDYLEQEPADLGKGIAREDLFAALMKYKFSDGKKALTALKVSNQELCAIAGFYFKCKNEYRNFSSHANLHYNSQAEEDFVDVLKEKIMSSVAPFIHIK